MYFLIFVLGISTIDDLTYTYSAFLYLLKEKKPTRIDLLRFYLYKSLISKTKDINKSRYCEDITIQTSDSQISINFIHVGLIYALNNQLAIDDELRNSKNSIIKSMKATISEIFEIDVKYITYKQFTETNFNITNHDQVEKIRTSKFIEIKNEEKEAFHQMIKDLEFDFIYELADYNIKNKVERIKFDIKTQEISLLLNYIEQNEVVQLYCKIEEMLEYVQTKNDLEIIDEKLKKVKIIHNYYNISKDLNLQKTVFPNKIYTIFLNSIKAAEDNFLKSLDERKNYIDNIFNKKNEALLYKKR